MSRKHPHNEDDRGSKRPRTRSQTHHAGDYIAIVTDSKEREVKIDVVDAIHNNDINTVAYAINNNLPVSWPRAILEALEQGNLEICRLLLVKYKGSWVELINGYSKQPTFNPEIFDLIYSYFTTHEKGKKHKLGKEHIVFNLMQALLHCIETGKIGCIHKLKNELDFTHKTIRKNILTAAIKANNIELIAEVASQTPLDAERDELIILSIQYSSSVDQFMTLVENFPDIVQVNIFRTEYMINKITHYQRVSFIEALISSRRYGEAVRKYLLDTPEIITSFAGGISPHIRKLPEGKVQEKDPTKNLERLINIYRSISNNPDFLTNNSILRIAVSVGYNQFSNPLDVMENLSRFFNLKKIVTPENIKEHPYIIALIVTMYRKSNTTDTESYGTERYYETDQDDVIDEFIVRTAIQKWNQNNHRELIKIIHLDPTRFIKWLSPETYTRLLHWTLYDPKENIRRMLRGRTLGDFLRHHGISSSQIAERPDWFHIFSGRGSADSNSRTRITTDPRHLVSNYVGTDYSHEERYARMLRGVVREFEQGHLEINTHGLFSNELYRHEYTQVQIFPFFIQGSLSLLATFYEIVENHQNPMYAIYDGGIEWRLFNVNNVNRVVRRITETNTATEFMNLIATHGMTNSDFNNHLSDDRIDDIVERFIKKFLHDNPNNIFYYIREFIDAMNINVKTLSYNNKVRILKILLENIKLSSITALTRAVEEFNRKWFDETETTENGLTFQYMKAVTIKMLSHNKFTTFKEMMIEMINRVDVAGWRIFRRPMISFWREQKPLWGEQVTASDEHDIDLSKYY